MAKRKRRVRRTKPVKEEILVEEEDLDLEEDDDLDDDEEEPVKPKKTRRSRRKVVEPVDDEDDEELEEEEEEPVKKKRARKKKGQRIKRQKRTVVQDDTSEETVDGGKVETDNLLADFLAVLEPGKALLITRVKKSQWTVQVAEAPTTQKLRGKAYYDKVRTPEYQEWRAEWRQLSAAEKAAQAEKMGVEWDEHDDPRIDAMRLTTAVREHLGIEKYKEEYTSRSARAQLRG